MKIEPIQLHGLDAYPETHNMMEDAVLRVWYYFDNVLQ